MMMWHLSEARESLFEVRHQILGVLDSDRVPDQALRYNDGCSLKRLDDEENQGGRR